jgi:hypothetical protein
MVRRLDSIGREREINEVDGEATGRDKEEEKKEEEKKEKGEKGNKKEIFYLFLEIVIHKFYFTY